MDVFALDLFNPPAAPSRRWRGRGDDGWGLWRPMTDPSWAQSLTTWAPHAEVSRGNDDKALHIRFETPGFPRDRLNVELSDDRSVLTVSGAMRKKAPTAGRDGDAPPAAGANGAAAEGATAPNAWAAAVEERAFSQSYRLPRDVDVEAIKADYEHGVLSITVPTKGPEALPQKRSIAIEDKEVSGSK